MTPLFESLLTALGVGLLVGLTRERRRNVAEPGRMSAAGLRTHALAGLASAVAWHVDARVFLVLFLLIGALVVMAYRHTGQADPGLTGEVALLTTTLLGALAIESVALAAAFGVVTAVLLQFRGQLHRLGRELITDREVHDGLLLAASALVVLPLLSTRPVDPWGVIVPASLWKLVVLVMAAGMAGEVAVRLVGPRFGLPAAGFFSGFASSTAATVGYGQRARENPLLLPYAASAALFANLATLLLLAAVVATANVMLARQLAWPLLAAGTALLAGGTAGFLAGHVPAGDAPLAAPAHAFKLSHALALALFVAVLLVVSALLSDAVGRQGAIAAAVIAATVELQGAALTISELAGSGRLPGDHARWGVVLLLASSSTSKSVLAFGSGGRAYGARVATGLGAAVAAAAAAAWLGR